MVPWGDVMLRLRRGRMVFQIADATKGLSGVECPVNQAGKTIFLPFYQVTMNIREGTL
jgi:hypothetical protein